MTPTSPAPPPFSSYTSIHVKNLEHFPAVCMSRWAGVKNNP